MHWLFFLCLVRLFCSQIVSSFQDQKCACSAKFQKAELGSTDECKCGFQLNCRQMPFLRITLCKQGPGHPGGDGSPWMLQVFRRRPATQWWGCNQKSCSTGGRSDERSFEAPLGLQDSDSKYRSQLDIISPEVTLVCLDFDMERHLPHRGPGGWQHS